MSEEQLTLERELQRLESLIHHYRSTIKKLKNINTLPSETIEFALEAVCARRSTVALKLRKLKGAQRG